MKNVTRILLAMMVFAFVTGCEITPPKLKIKSPIEVETDHDSHHGKGEGDFCPPGQAKKGRC